MKQLESLFLEELSEIYDAEQRIASALPVLQTAATDQELKDFLRKQTRKVGEQMNLLEAVFRSFARPVTTRRCQAMAGLIGEARDVVSAHNGEPCIDAALISATQKVKHYEIASFGCLREWATKIGNDRAAEILGNLLEEEKEMDSLLTEIARAQCNETAWEESVDGARDRVGVACVDALYAMRGK